MKIEIGGNIKRLRKARGMTQEALADALGISFQAVSKWERGDGYPDITILPPLASFFGVTLDALLGQDAEKDAAQAQAILDEAYANAADGRIAANIPLLREAVKRFPGDDRLRLQLARSLHALQTDVATAAQNTEEAAEITERILERCTESATRHQAQTLLCYAYADLGLREKAAEDDGDLCMPLPIVGRDDPGTPMPCGRRSTSDSSASAAVLSKALRGGLPSTARRGRRALRKACALNPRPAQNIPSTQRQHNSLRRLRIGVRNDGGRRWGRFRKHSSPPNQCISRAGIIGGFDNLLG